MRVGQSSRTVEGILICLLQDSRFETGHKRRVSCDVSAELPRTGPRGGRTLFLKRDIKVPGHMLLNEL
jgi:hypothetical protein